MCGIAVYFNKKGISLKELKENLASLKSIRHRGPDGEGAILINTQTKNAEILGTDETPASITFQNTVQNYKENSAHLFLGHRRLSIIDTSINGHQPMSLNNKYWITFNGEIYNYLEIRKELIELGYSFKTNSDTEVVLAAYDKWKEGALKKFNGMFSFVIYDQAENLLFAANDRYGVKPLYYYLDSGHIVFFSEISQIKNYPFTRTLNKNVLKEFLNFGYLDYDASTVYNEIKRFNPSHFAFIDLNNFSGDIKFIPYYHLEFKKEKISFNDAKEKFNILFNDAVDLRLRSDVVVGCSISGGLDSSSILIRAVENLKRKNIPTPINTFSVVFPGLQGDESEFINLMIENLNVKSHFVNALEDFTTVDFEKHMSHQDFPVTTTSFYAEWSLARKVRTSNVTVLLNGQGGDEILAGYHHHFYKYCRQLITTGKISKYLSLAKAYAELKNIKVNTLHKLVINDIKLSVKFKLGLADLGSSLANKWANAGSLIDILKLDFTEYMLPTYLRSDDRNFMAFSVETRHPFLDFNLVNFCNSLPDEYKINEGWQKWLLRKSIDSLPETIKYRKDKKGYTTPQELWLKNHDKEFQSYLSYIPAEYREIKSKNPFFQYSLGAWFKSNLSG